MPCGFFVFVLVSTRARSDLYRSTSTTTAPGHQDHILPEVLGDLRVCAISHETSVTATAVSSRSAIVRTLLLFCSGASSSATGNLGEQMRKSSNARRTTVVHPHLRIRDRRRRRLRYADQRLDVSR